MLRILYAHYLLLLYLLITQCTTSNAKINLTTSCYQAAQQQGQQNVQQYVQQQGQVDWFCNAYLDCCNAHCIYGYVVAYCGPALTSCVCNTASKLIFVHFIYIVMLVLFILFVC
jgi:hypothetical protein